MKPAALIRHYRAVADASTVPMPDPDGVEEIQEILAAAGLL
jgi:hypothetical protein